MYHVAKKTCVLIYVVQNLMNFILSDLILSKHVDVLGMAETLLSKDDTACVLSGCQGSKVLSTEQF